MAPNEPNTTSTTTSLLPDWIKTPQAWLAGVLIGWLLQAWDLIIGFMESMYSTLESIPRLAFYDPISMAFRLPGQAIQDAWREVGTIAVDVSEAAGPFAPIVVVGVWLIPALIGVTALYIVWGFLETYLPLDSIPILRRLTS